MNRVSLYHLAALLAFPSLSLSAQDEGRPRLAAHTIAEAITVDGRLDEADWEEAELLDGFKTIVRVEGGTPSRRTTLRVLAHPRFLVIGIECFSDAPGDLVNFSKLRDSELENEDYVRIVIDPFLDGQSGIIFAVNASGARYDALVSNRGTAPPPGWISPTRRPGSRGIKTS